MAQPPTNPRQWVNQARGTGWKGNGQLPTPQQHRVSPGVYRPGPAPVAPPPIGSLGTPNMQSMWKPNPGQAFSGLGDALSKVQFNKWPQQIHSGPPLPNGIAHVGNEVQMAQAQQAAEQAMPQAPPSNQWQPGMPTHAPLARAIAKPAPTPGYAKAGFKSRTAFVKDRAYRKTAATMQPPAPAPITSPRGQNMDNTGGYGGESFDTKM